MEVADSAETCNVKHWFFDFRCSRIKHDDQHHRHAGCSWAEDVGAETNAARRKYIAEAGER